MINISKSTSIEKVNSNVRMMVFYFIVLMFSLIFIFIWWKCKFLIHDICFCKNIDFFQFLQILQKVNFLWYKLPNCYDGILLLQLKLAQIFRFYWVHLIQIDESSLNYYHEFHNTISLNQIWHCLFSSIDKFELTHKKFHIELNQFLLIFWLKMDLFQK